MAVTETEKGTFVPIRSGVPCPVCGSKKGRCSEFYNTDEVKVFYRCKNAVSSKESFGWYIHTVLEIDGVDPTERPQKMLPTVKVGEEMSEERKKITNEAYRYLRELIKSYEGSYLNKRDMSDLRTRGLLDEQIERMLYFSLPTTELNSQEEVDQFLQSKPKRLYIKEKKYNKKPVKVMVRNYSDGNSTYDCQLITAISKDMERKFSANLLQVAGFVKKTDPKGNEYVSMTTTRFNPQYETITNMLTIALITKDQKLINYICSTFWRVEQFIPIKGYFIPYINPDGQIMAMQYRLTVALLDEKGKTMRYFWYSSANARSGSPIDYYIPTKIYTDKKGNVREDILLVTEGAIKAKISSEILGYKSVAEAGVSNYRRLVDTIIEISKKEGIKHKIVLALDMDKFDNKEVLSAEQETITLLLEAGYEVALATWDLTKKGIDDALMCGCRINYTMI
jgi:hypothetical protein